MPLEISSQEKLRALLFSSDPKNQVLALHFLLEEVPEKFWSYLVAIQSVTATEELRDLSTEIFYKYQKEELLACTTRSSFYDTEAFEQFLEEEQQLFEQFPFIKKEDFAVAVLYLEKIGLGYCLSRGLMPPAEALALFVEGNHLDLFRQNITHLPKEIGNLGFLKTIAIGGNHIEKVDAEVGKLKNLQNIYDYDTTYSFEAEEQMHRFFPGIYAEKFNSKAGTAYNKGQHEEAAKAIEKAIKLSPLENNYLITKAAIIIGKENDQEKAITYLRRAANYREDDESSLLTATLAFSNMSFSYKCLQQNDKALEVALEGLALYEKFPALPKRWEQTLLFRKASALYALNDLQASFEVYQQSLKKYPSDNASELYNLACIYARWQDRAKVLSHLARAIAIKPAHKAEALADSDFQDYWQDPDFMALVKEED